MRPGASIYLLIGLWAASTSDVHEMSQPMPYRRFPQHLFRLQQLRFVVGVIYLVLWLPIFATATALSMRRRLRQHR